MFDKIKRTYQSIFHHERRKTAFSCLFHVFRKLNIEAKEEEQNDDYYTCQFEYQGGRFTIYASKTNSDVVVRFPWFFEEHEKYRPLVAMVANNLNVDYMDFVYLHTYYAEENKVGAHLKTQVELYDTTERSVEMFRSRMARFFTMQRLFEKEFEKQRGPYERNIRSDLYEMIAKDQRENYLMLEHEMQKHEKGILHLPEKAAFPLLSLLDHIPYREQLSNVTHMSFISSSRVERLDSEEAIRDFDLRSALQTDDSDSFAPFAQILLRYGKSNVIIDFNRESQTEGKFVYYSVTLFDSWQFQKGTKEVPKPTHCLIAFDLASSEELKAEVKFMRDDALDKIQEGNLDKLTEAQRLMKEFADWSVADDIYWGEKCYLDQRYIEAISHFEKALGALNPIFLRLNRTKRNVVYDIYYRTGFCYAALNNYPKAFYYLNVPFVAGSLRASIEYVNCLVNAKDIRALSIINHQLESVRDAMSGDDDDEEDESELGNENMEFYYKFLLRRKSFVLIDSGDYDQAEQVLKGMLKMDDQELSDYALRELTYIENHRKQQQEEEKESESKGETEKS